MAINWGDLAAGGLGGAGTGATAGAAIGSAFPVVGTGIGAGVGAGVGGLAGILASIFGDQGRKGGPQRLASPNSQEQSILEYLLNSGLGQLKDPQQGFKPIEDYARTQFANRTVPSLAERFTSFAGGNNALSSPSFASQLGQAGGELEQALAAMGAQYGQQNQHNALSQLTLGLSPAFQTDYRATEHGTGTNFLSALLQSKALPKAIQAAPQLYQQYLANQKLSNEAKGKS